MTDQDKPTEPRTIWLANHAVDAHSNPTEPNLYPHAFTAFVPKEALEAAQREIERLNKAVEMFSTTEHSVITFTKQMLADIKQENARLNKVRIACAVSLTEILGMLLPYDKNGNVNPQVTLVLEALRELEE